jgi:signal transduction histidine kinase
MDQERNPTAVVPNPLNFLRLRASDSATKRAQRILEPQVSRLVRLVDDLMELSRSAHGVLPAGAKPVDLAEFVRRAVEGSAPLVEAARQELVILIPAEPILLHADPPRLEQAIARLLNDAARSTLEGSAIRMTVGREGPHALVSVHDNGIGMVTEMLSKVFAVFSRQDGGFEARSDGPGGGCEFLVRLPLSGRTVPPRPLRDD